MKRYLAFSVIVRILASVLLFWAALSHHPSSYYTLLRWVVFGAGAYSVYVAVAFNQISWAWCFGLIALFFNPLIPVWLNRATWVNIDVAAGVILILSIFTLRRTKKAIASQTGTASESSQRYASVSLPTKGKSKKRIATSYVSEIPADSKTTPEFSKYPSLGRAKKWEAHATHTSPDFAKTARPRTVRFLPLAISSMKGNSICVAGVNVDKLDWIRTVRAGTYSMEKVHKDWFHVNQIHEIRLIENQPRPRQFDPWGLHVEDWVIKDHPRLVGPISPPEKMALLQDLQDKDLKASLLDKRSLFLIEPTNFRVIPQEGKLPKIAFSVGYTNTNDLRDNHLLQASHIGISSFGCPCTCLRWPELVRQLGNISDESTIRELGDDVKTYFTLSLAAAWRPPDLPEKKKKHYLLVAGIHVVGKERIWL
jgi:hypothetical protein